MKKEFVLWVHYNDNSVGVSDHSTYEDAVKALSEENPDEVMEWEINPTYDNGPIVDSAGFTEEDR